MNFLEVKAELESQFSTWKNSAYPALQVHWENTTLNNVSNWYFAINILPSVSTDVEIGRNCAILSQGLMNIRIIGPTNSGSGSGFGYADAVVAAFENKKFSDIVTDAAQMNVIGEVENKFVLTVSVPWRVHR